MCHALRDTGTSPGPCPQGWQTSHAVHGSSWWIRGSDGRPRTGWRIIPGWAENVGETSIIFLWEGCPGAPWGVRIVAPARRPPCRWPARPHARSPRGQRPPPRWRPLPRLRRGPAALSARDRFPSLPAWPHRARPPGVRVRGPGQRSPHPALRALCLGHASAL